MIRTKKPGGSQRNPHDLENTDCLAGEADDEEEEEEDDKKEQAAEEEEKEEEKKMMDIEDEKKGIIHREIDKFRETMKIREAEKEVTGGGKSNG